MVNRVVNEAGRTAEEQLAYDQARGGPANRPVDYQAGTDPNRPIVGYPAGYGPESGASIERQIAALEAEIVDLKARQDELRRAQLPQYPKHVLTPETEKAKDAREGENIERQKRGSDPIGAPFVVVNTQAEEDAALARSGPAGYETPEAKANREALNADRAKQGLAPIPAPPAFVAPAVQG